MAISSSRTLPSLAICNSLYFATRARKCIFSKSAEVRFRNNAKELLRIFLHLLSSTHRHKDLSRHYRTWTIELGGTPWTRNNEKASIRKRSMSFEQSAWDWMSMCRQVVRRIVYDQNTAQTRYSCHRRSLPAGWCLRKLLVKWFTKSSQINDTQ